MQTKNILQADFLDILFEGRNKDYGAYQLRKTYNRRLGTAVGAMILVCLLLFFGSLFAGSTATDPPLVFTEEIELKAIEEQKPEPPITPPTLPPPSQQHVAVSQYAPPIIMPDELVPEEDELKDMADLENTQIGKFDVTGKDVGEYVAPPVEKGISGTPTLQKTSQDYEKEFHPIEIQARFPGGPEAWKKYLERNLNSQLPSEEGAPVGRYTVTVQFIVDKDGNISEVKAIDVPKECAACGPEAVKIIRRGGKWEPAIQNGRAVTYAAVQHITFSVEAD